MTKTINGQNSVATSTKTNEMKIAKMNCINASVDLLDAVRAYFISSPIEEEEAMNKMRECHRRDLKARLALREIENKESKED